jgi:O-antigen/teichoic acid export membrane protein
MAQMSGHGGAPPPPGNGGLRDRFLYGMTRVVPSGGLRRAVVTIAGGQALAAILVALTYPATTRLYTPAEFGAFAAVVSLLSLVLTVTCLTYDQAIPLPEKEETAADLVVLSLIGTVVITTVCAAVLLLFGRQLLGRFDAQALASYWWLLALAQLAGGVYVAFTGWAIRARDYNGLAVARLAQAVLSSAGQVGAGVAGAGAPGLVLGDGLGRAAAGGRLSRRVREQLLRSMGDVTVDRLSRTAIRYRRFPLIGSWSTLINSIGFEAPLLLLVAFYGSSTGGLFAFAQRLIGAPVALVVLAVGQVFVAEAAGRARDDATDLVEFFRATLRRLALIAAPLMLCIALGATLLVEPLFGSKWKEAGTYILLLAPLYTMQLLSSPLGGILAVLERQDLALVREVVRILLLALAIGAARALALSATWAVILLSGAGTLAYVLYGFISWHALQVDARRRTIVRGKVGEEQ